MASRYSSQRKKSSEGKSRYSSIRAGIQPSSNEGSSQRSSDLVRQARTQQVQQSQPLSAQYKQYANLMKPAREMEIKNVKSQQGREAAQKFAASLSPRSDTLSLNMGPITQEKYNTEIDKRNNFNVDDVMKAYQDNDPAAMKRLENSGWNELPVEEKTKWRNVALERKSELGRQNRDSVANVLGKFGDVTKPFADIAMDIYTPGAGLGVINALTQGAEYGVARALPGLARTALSQAPEGATLFQKSLPSLAKVGQTALTEGIVGVPTQFANTLTRTGDLEQAAKEGLLYGGLGGAVLGGAGRAVGEGVQGLRSLANNAAQDVVQGNIRATMDDLGKLPRSQNEPLRPTINPVSESVPVTSQPVSKYSEVRKQAEPIVTPQEVRTVEQVEEFIQPSRERGNVSTQLESGRLSDELQDEINKRDNTYTPRTHAQALKEANESIAKNISDEEVRFLGNKEVTDTHVATGYRLMQELDRIGEYERAANISSKLMDDLTRAGQTSSAARIIQRLSPEGQLMHLQRVAKESGQEVSVADTQVYKTLAKDVQQGSLSGKETSDFMKTLDKLKKGESVSDDEINKARMILEDAQQYVKSGKKPKPITEELKDVRTRDKVLSYFEQQAAEARKAWDAKRNVGFAQRLEEPDIVLLAKMAAYKVAKGVVSVADFTEFLVKEFGESVRPYAQAVYERARDVVKSTSKGISEGKLQEATEAFERLTKGRTDAEKVANKFMKENKINAKDADKINALVKDLNKLKGAKSTDAEIQMQKILNKYQKSSINDKLNALRYIAMLLNTATQGVNALSGPIMASSGAVFDLFGSMAEMVLAPIMKRQRTTALWGSNPLRFLGGFFKNLATGAKAGWHGAEPSGIRSQSDLRGLVFKSNYNPLNWLERSLGAVSKGPDYGTYKTVFDSEIKRQAGLAASRQGLKGADRESFIERFIVNPPDESIEIADRIGKSTTFQRQDSLAGQTAQALASAGANFPKVGKYVEPGVRSVFPFIKTPLNIASSSVKLTPAGILKGLFTLARGDLTPAMQRDAVRELGMGITGTGIGALGFYLSDLGVITGANDSGNKDVDAVREQAGQGKYRFNTSALTRAVGAIINGEGWEGAKEAAQYQEGDRQFDYNKLQPIAFPLAAGASLQENNGDIGKMLTDASGSLLGMSSLTGLQNITQKPLQGTVAEKALQLPANIIESYLKSFSPSLLAQEARRQDTTQRKTPYAEGIVPDVRGYFQSRFPGQSQNLPPRMSALGDIPQYSGGITGQYLNPYRSEAANFNKAAVILSDLIDRTGDMTLAPSAPEKKLTGGGQTVAIPPERYVKYQEDIGKEITRQIINLGFMSDAEKVEKIKDIYSKVKEQYRNQLKKELGIVVKR